MVSEERKVAFLNDSDSGGPEPGRPACRTARGAAQWPKDPTIDFSALPLYGERGIRFAHITEMQGFTMENQCSQPYRSPFGNPLTVGFWFFSLQSRWLAGLSGPSPHGARTTAAEPQAVQSGKVKSCKTWKSVKSGCQGNDRFRGRMFHFGGGHGF